jgi:hypothetical protein
MRMPRAGKTVQTVTDDIPAELTVIVTLTCHHLIGILLAYLDLFELRLHLCFLCILPRSDVGKLLGGSVSSIIIEDTRQKKKS